MDKYCDACPRGCRADRAAGQLGFCGCGDTAHITRVSLHKWEEPTVSGVLGSGTLFFSGCSLRCVFCQNRDISRNERGREMSARELADAMLALRQAGAHNVNLVTPTHYIETVVKALELVKPSLGIPVVYNCGGYESLRSLKRLEGLIDVYLPDLKYFSSELSARYSAAPDYFEVAASALSEMYRQVGGATFAPYRGGNEGAKGACDTSVLCHTEEGGDLIVKGVIVRHLVLPGCRKDSIQLLEALASLLPVDGIRLSLMRQFTPDFVSREDYPELCRRLTRFEYESVLKKADELGFIGYSQSAEAASAEFTPEFCSAEAFELLDKN